MMIKEEEKKNDSFMLHYNMKCITNYYYCYYHLYFNTIK